ncbi:hypothetical protein I4U23_027083 [Adineta vaga]|nr:hypothetical protein I4U23_027083 [Adineta vaga]
MGNDTRFIEAEDLPFRLIDIPIGTAPPPPSPPPIRKSHKRHAPPIPPPRVDGYDAPPSLPPPPIVPKRFDIPTPKIPPRSDLNQRNLNQYYKPKKLHYHRKKLPKPNLSCCVIS